MVGFLYWVLFSVKGYVARLCLVAETNVGRETKNENIYT
jgi:hypothetical protein